LVFLSACYCAPTNNPLAAMTFGNLSTFRRHAPMSGSGNFDPATWAISRLAVAQVEAKSALIVGSFSAFLRTRGKIVELAARHKIAAMYPNRQYVVDGGLMSYAAAGPVSRLIGRNYVGEILKGAKPTDLPVRQPTQFALVINVKTAKALGLTIPRPLFAATTEWIE
jgi:putative tryptophan/tyrosine transport system substrate-binding protein